ncbi:MAG TPA: hypothetical protein VF815_35200 [Myxococcaceae bacterium]|jgi:hypothetical protein
MIHQSFLNALLGQDSQGRCIDRRGQANRWKRSQQVLDQATPHQIALLYQTLTAHPQEWLFLYFHDAENFSDDLAGTQRHALLNRMERRLAQPLTKDASRFLQFKPDARTSLAQPCSPGPMSPLLPRRPVSSSVAASAKQPAQAPEPLDSTIDPIWGGRYQVGDSTGPNVLLGLKKGPGGMQYSWFNFHTGTAVTGTVEQWRLLTQLSAFASTTTAYRKLAKSLSPAEWRALGPQPAMALLARYEAGTLDIEDEVVVDLYLGLVHQLARARLDENEQLVDTLLEEQDQLEHREAYCAGLKEASSVRDALEARRSGARRVQSLREHSAGIGIARLAVAPRPSMLHRLEAMDEEEQIEMALQLWMKAFPMLTRLKTGEFTPHNVRATLGKIKSDIQRARKDLVSDGVHAPRLDPWDLANVRPYVDATLGKRARAVLEAEARSRARWAWVETGALFALSMGLLFLPGGAFIDAAIGIALVSKSLDEASALGHAANTGLQVDAGLVTLAQAQSAQFSAMLGVVFLVMGVAAQGSPLLRRWRAFKTTTAGELADMPDLVRRSVDFFFLGNGTKPTHLEVEELLQLAWTELKAHPRTMPEIRVGKMPGTAEGTFDAWAGKFGEIAIKAKEMSQAQKINVVFHEARHARMAQQFPTLAGRASRGGLKFDLWAHINEMVAYAYGARAAMKHAPKLSDKLMGLLEFLLSPWLAYASLGNWTQRLPALIRDAILVTLFVYWQLRRLEARHKALDALYPAQATSP